MTELFEFALDKLDLGRTYHSFAEQLEDLYQQHVSLPKRHKRLRDLPEDTITLN